MKEVLLKTGINLNIVEYKAFFSNNTESHCLVLI